jgi:DNA polymerase-4
VTDSTPATVQLGESPEARADALRGILCADVDAMYATIEALERGLGPDIPILVGGSPEERGVVSTASYAARRFGCHSAMPMAQAMRLCPQALRIQPRHDLYGQYSERIMETLRAYGPLEQMSVDEAFVEVGPDGITRSLGQAAKDAVRQATQLTVSIGLSRNKLVSKVASGIHKPDGLTVIPLGQEAAFLAPLDIGRLWGVGPKTQARLTELGILTCADLSKLPLDVLVAKFGQSSGQSLYDHSRGIDDSPVVTHHDLKQVSQETTFVQDVVDRAKLWTTIQEQARGIAGRLQSHGMMARTVTLKLRYADFHVVSRSATLVVASDNAAEIAQAAAGLVRANWDRRRPVRLVGIGASRFVPSESWVQLALPAGE